MYIKRRYSPSALITRLSYQFNFLKTALSKDFSGGETISSIFGK